MVYKILFPTIKKIILFRLNKIGISHNWKKNRYIILLKTALLKKSFGLGDES